MFQKKLINNLTISHSNDLKQLKILSLMFKHLFLSSECHFYTRQEKKTTKNRILTCFNTLKFDIISMVKLLDYEMISIFLKHPVFIMLWGIIFNLSDSSIVTSPTTILLILL